MAMSHIDVNVTLLLPDQLGLQSPSPIPALRHRVQTDESGTKPFELCDSYEDTLKEAQSLIETKKIEKERIKEQIEEEKRKMFLAEQEGDDDDFEDDDADDDDDDFTTSSDADDEDDDDDFFHDDL